jgi:predicted RecB family nuclease
MDMNISQDVLEAYFHCKYKSHLKYTGQQGGRSEYESLFSELRKRVRLQAIDQESCKNSGNDEIRDAPLTFLTLKKGSAFIVSPHVEEGPFSWTFDAIKRLQGPSKLGDFHYVPVLFHGHRQVGKAQRLLLDVQALLLSRIQGRLPGTGIIYHGQQCRAKRVRLHSDVRKTEGFLEEIKRQCHTLAPPKLILNDHCHQC